MNMGLWCNDHRDRGNTKSSSCPGPVPFHPPQFVHRVMESLLKVSVKIWSLLYGSLLSKHYSALD